MAMHDAGYRSLFSDKQMIAHLIQGFIRQKWVQDLDLETLELVRGSFVAEGFKKRENDVIWRVKFRNQWLYVYLLIEFQSTVDRFMALRLMVYVGLLYQQLVQEKRLEHGKPLPPVLPIVLYNGKQPWHAPLDVAELIAECPEELAVYRPRMRYFLLAEHAEDPQKLAGMKNLAALVFRFEQCRTRDEFEQAAEALRDWVLAPEHRRSVQRLVRWVQMLFGSRSASGEPIAALDEIQEYGAMLKEQIKVWEKELREEGMKEGIEKGKTAGEAEVLVRLLEGKFGEIPDEFRRRIRAADSSQLLTWAERLLTADSIGKVFES